MQAVEGKPEDGTRRKPGGPSRQEIGHAVRCRYPAKVGAVLLLLVAAPAMGLPQQPVRGGTPAQAKAPAVVKDPGEGRVRTVTVTGNQLFSQEQIALVSGVRTGAQASQAVFDAARDRLLKTGAFQTVGYEYRVDGQGVNYDLEWQVAEVEQVFPLRIQGFAVQDDQLLPCLAKREPLFGERMPGTAEFLARLAGVAEACLAAQGLEEKTRASVSADGPDDLYILLGPSRQLPSVASVRFQNSEAIPAYALQNRMASVSVGTLYTEERLRQILEANIRPMYEALGRLEVRFPEVTTEPAEDVKGLVVTVTVEEGPVFEFGKVDIAGDGIKADELLRAAKLEEGDPANFEEVAAAQQRIATILRKQGYMRTSSRVERKMRSGDRAVDLTIQVEKGPQFTFRSLKIEGLDIIAQAGVRKLWAPKPGQPFNADYPDFFLEQIHERGVFDNLGGAKAAIETDEKEHAVDVTLFFRGAERPKPKPRF